MLQSIRLVIVPKYAFNLLHRLKSSAASDVPAGVTLSNDERTIICWHPKKPFPYELSQPLPEKKVVEDASVLNVQATAALKHIYRPKPPELERQELMRLTHTTKHVWFPNNRHFKKKKIPMDRPYL